jgi:hypothetical protein
VNINELDPGVRARSVIVDKVDMLELQIRAETAEIQLLVHELNQKERMVKQLREILEEERTKRQTSSP